MDSNPCDRRTRFHLESHGKESGGMAGIAPPNVNSQCTVAGGTVGGGTLPCAITNYTNIAPSLYTFDLSGGYDTGDNPANDYLKHVAIQLVVQNLLDRNPPFQYRILPLGANPAAFDILKSDQGRTISLILTKTW